MGLAERRFAKEFQENTYPALKREIDAAAGFDVALEINWEQLTSTNEVSLYPECWPKVYFKPLAAGLGSVARDDMGRDALKAGLKKVVIRNTAAISNGTRWATFADGVLTLDHVPTTNIGDVEDRTDSLVKALENGL